MSNQLLAAGGVQHLRLSKLQTAQLEAAGIGVYRIDRAPVFNQITLLHAIYQAAMLPAYFGFNWDALKDCLSDLSWLPDSAGTALVLRDSALLEAREPRTLETLCEIVEAAAALRHQRGLPALHLLLGEPTKFE